MVDAHGERQGGTFLRKSSGVIRTMSPRDGMYFGYLSATGLYGVAIYLFVGIATFSGANIFLSTIISFVLFGAVFWVYSVLGSAMPRSGGDYVFTSRILLPAIGFTLGFAGWAFWQFFYSFFAANTVVVGGLAPLFSAIGVTYHSRFWLNASTWVASTGPRIGLTIALLLIAGLVMVRGLRVYLRIQKYFMMPATVLAILIIVGELLFVSHAAFLSNFNHFERSVGGLSAAAIPHVAAIHGYKPAGFSWGATWGLSVLLAGAYLWCMWQTELLGEFKNAKSFRNVLATMIGADFLLMVTFMVGIGWLFEYVGPHLMGAFSYLAANYPAALGGGWAFRGAATLFVVPTLNIVLIILIFLGFIGPMSQSMFNTTLTASRIYLSMSFDRVLPAAVGEVNRVGAPWVAVVISVAVSIVLTFVYALQPNLTDAWFAATVASLIAMLGTTIAGTMLPYRLPEVYNVSPAAKYRIFGVPAITIIGTIASCFLAGTILWYVFDPAYGLLTGPALASWIMMAVLGVGAPIYFWLAGKSRARAGIQLRYAFDTIPPE